jgi:Holliday junction resolvasome RuvABC endonuclease subunit
MQRLKWKIDVYTIEYTEQMPKLMCVGVDPGTTNLGICVLWDQLKIFNLYKVTIERDANPVQRILDAQQIMSACVNSYPYTINVGIEGASFGDNFRQVELAEQRASIALWASNRNFNVSIMPPNTIRKKAFGSAKIKAHEIWTNIPQDCAAALSCALAVSL